MAELDDSLLLGWNSGPVGPGESALSASTVKRVKEDPMKHYLKKVEGLDEPTNPYLAMGTAAHEAFEAFFDGASVDGALSEAQGSFRGVWEEVEDYTIRENTEDATNPRNKEEITLGRREAFGRVVGAIQPALELFNDPIDWAPYGLLQAQRRGREDCRTEVSIGQLAAENGQGYAEPTIYDHSERAKVPKKTAVIAGVPVRGEADLVCDWPHAEGSVLIDHKLLSRAVSYYPRRNGDGRKSYPPSYNAKDSPQLDIYALATGIPRAGFQMILRYPQYVPPDNVLWEEWIEEEQWLGAERPGDLLPKEWVTFGDELRYVSVWRPQPEDHPSGPDSYTLRSIRPRTESLIRDVAEFLTEGFILLENGYEPSVAFPAGDPEEIARKACPFCHFNDTGACPAPRDTSNAEQEHEDQWAERKLATENVSEIRERREHWENEWR